MKILILTDGLFPYVVGGMQKHSQYLTRYLSNLGHEVTVAHCIKGNNFPTNDQLRESLGLFPGSKLEVVSVPFPQLGRAPGHYLKESYLYSKLLYNKISSRINEFDFIYAKGFSAWHFIEQKKKGIRMPPIGVKFHGYEMFQRPPSFSAWIQQLLLRQPVRWNSVNADYVFSYGGKITQIIRSIGVPQERIISIPSGIEASWCSNELKEHSGPLRFLFIGRFERRKGVEELHAALNLLGSGGCSITFVGPIPECKKLKLPNCGYPGQITDISRLKNIMDECDVLVVPSHSEGMPNVILEGMSRGLAILATDVGAVSSLVDSENGWIIRSLKPALLARQLNEVAHSTREDVEKRRRMSVKKIRENFTWEAVSLRLEASIKSIVDKSE